MTRHIDGHDVGQLEIPDQTRIYEGSDEATTGSIHMNRGVESLCDQGVIDPLDILVLSGVCRSKNRTDTNGVLIHQLDSLGGIDHVSCLCARDQFLIDLEVSCSLLPAYLNPRAHDDIGLRGVFSFCLPLVLPSFLHGECG